MYTISLVILATFVSVSLSLNYPVYFQPNWPAEPEFHGPFSNPALQWSYTLLQLIRLSNNFSFSNPGSALNSNHFGANARAAIILTDCMYDAWLQAKRPLLGNTISGKWITTTFLNSDANVNQAVSYSAYRAMTYVFGGLNPIFQYYIDDQLTALGGQPSLATSVSPTTPNGAGNLACLNVINGTNRDNDGSNALGLEEGYPGLYQDYTNYNPINDPFPQIGKVDCSAFRKGIDTWSPARYNTTAPGSPVVTSATQVWSDVQFSNVKPFALRSGAEYGTVQHPTRNVTVERDQWYAKNADIVQRSGMLNDSWKALGNYWGENEGYGGCQVSLGIAMRAAMVKGSNLENTIKLLLTTAHSYMDALITQYYGKRYWQSPRPVAVVQCIYAGKQILAWQGPYMGVGMLDGSNWRAYQAMSAIHPPNPEYPCGHCIGSSAAVNAIALYYKDPNFAGFPRSYQPGQFSLEPKITAGQPGYIAGVTDVPNQGPATVGYAPAQEIVVSGGWVGWTWDQVGFSVGESRIWWGIHYNESNIRSHAWGNAISQRVHDAAFLLYNTPRIPFLTTDIPIMSVTASGKDYIVPGIGQIQCLANTGLDQLPK